MSMRIAATDGVFILDNRYRRDVCLRYHGGRTAGWDTMYGGCWFSSRLLTR